MEYWTNREIKNLVELYGYYKVPIYEIGIILNKKQIIIIQKLIDLKLIDDIRLTLNQEQNNQINPLEVLYRVQNDLNRRMGK